MALKGHYAGSTKSFHSLSPRKRRKLRYTASGGRPVFLAARVRKWKANFSVTLPCTWEFYCILAWFDSCFWPPWAGIIWCTTALVQFSDRYVQLPAETVLYAVIFHLLLLIYTLYKIFSLPEKKSKWLFDWRLHTFKIVILHRKVSAKEAPSVKFVLWSFLHPWCEDPHAEQINWVPLALHAPMRGPRCRGKCSGGRGTQLDQWAMHTSFLSSLLLFCEPRLRTWGFHCDSAVSIAKRRAQGKQSLSLWLEVIKLSFTANRLDFVHSFW